MLTLEASLRHGVESPSDSDARDLIEGLRTRLNDALRGKPEAVDLVLTCLLARGNLLIEDLPGLGKTTLAKALATAIGGRFSRVQCTPDLLPTDITGFNLFNPSTREFDFHPGPIFADVLLADEVNRTTPRTQSALLEAMAERQVTIDNSTHPLPATFFVIATQNPQELHGTFTLPEAQLDRFTIKISLGTPDREHLLELLERSAGRLDDHVEDAPPVLSTQDLLGLQQRCASVAAKRSVLEHVARIGEAVQRASLGGFVSPRALLQMLRCAKAWATLEGRDFVTPEDVRAVAIPTLRVRLPGDPAAVDADLARAIDSVAVPAFG